MVERSGAMCAAEKSGGYMFIGLPDFSATPATPLRYAAGSSRNEVFLQLSTAIFFMRLPWLETSHPTFHRISENRNACLGLQERSVWEGPSAVIKFTEKSALKGAGRPFFHLKFKHEQKAQW
jgi:hypothetical protein